jgi:type II secretory pathway predicted ATPase ExeA
MAKENHSSPAASLPAFRPRASRWQNRPAAAGSGEPQPAGPSQLREPPSVRRPAPLNPDPFSGLPDPGFLYTNGELRTIYNRLLVAIGARGGLFLLTGEGGTGKTALLTRLAEEMRATGYRVMTDVPADQDQVLPELAGRRAVLLIDGADGLDDAAIGRLASLLQAPPSGGSGEEAEPPRLLLSGRPSLAARLIRPKFAALKPALVMHCRLQRLSDADVAQLIWHRLRRAGHRGPGLFPEEAIAEIARLAHGLPGRAVQLGARAMDLADGAGSLIVFAEFVRQAADALTVDDGGPAADSDASVRAPSRPDRRFRRFGTALGGVAAAAAAVALFIYPAPDESRASIGQAIVSSLKERLSTATDAPSPAERERPGPGEDEARGASSPPEATAAAAPGMISFAQWTPPSETDPAKTVLPTPLLPADASDDGDAPGADGGAPVPILPEPPPLPPSDSLAQPAAADISSETVPAATAAALAEEPSRALPDRADDAVAPTDATAATAMLPAAEPAVPEGPPAAPAQGEETRRDEPPPQANEPDGNVAAAETAPESKAPAADGDAAPPREDDSAAAAVPAATERTDPAPPPSAAGTLPPPDPAPGIDDGAATDGVAATMPTVMLLPVQAAPAPPPAPTPPAVARGPSPPAGSAGAAPKSTAIPKGTIELLIRRGNEMLAAGDISAARLLYERAAAAGDARAATAAGKTYDPVFLGQIGAFGVAARPEQAVRWYRQAIEAGDNEAEARMARLQALSSRR